MKMGVGSWFASPFQDRYRMRSSKKNHLWTGRFGGRNGNQSAFRANKTWPRLEGTQRQGFLMTNCSLVALHNEVIGRHFVLKVKVFSVEKRERRRPTVFETQRKTGRYRHNRRGFVFEERLQKKRRRKQKQKKKKRNDTGTNFRLNDDANVQKKNRKESKKTTQQKQPNECILFFGGGG